MDTTNRTRAVVGGFSTNNEMCANFMFYYPKITHDIYGICTGEIRSKVYGNFLGILETTWSDTLRENVVTRPPENAGLTVSEVGTRIKWNIDKRMQLQTHHRFLPQVTSCASWSAEAVTRDLLFQTQGQNFSFLKQYLTNKQTQNHRLPTVTNVDAEVGNPEGEVVSLWPKIVEEYVPTTTCRTK